MLSIAFLHATVSLTVHGKGGGYSAQPYWLLVTFGRKRAKNNTTFLVST